MPAMDAKDAMDAPDFAGLLRRYRRRRHLTQEELAERAGISAASVSLLERGITQAPQKATVQMLSAALALAPEEAAAFHAEARRVRRPAVEPQAVTQPEGDGELPIPLTPLFGREHEDEALAGLLARDGTRLLTLTGPAGVGKTRLALQVAATMRRQHGWDVVVVVLVPVQETGRVLPAIAQAVGMPESGNVPVREALVQALRERRLLLVLDNFEQVLPAARAVLDLLIACPHVKALVTSRSPLNVRGEQRFPVSPLALPEPDQLTSVEALCRVPSVALFVDRASAVQPDFVVTTLEDGRLAATICERLDGLPLAIELAAAGVRHFGLRQLHDRLAELPVLGELTEGPQDLADHQRTMRSAIAWSYDLLTVEEQRLFRWLGVFVDTATLDAAEAVSGITGDALRTGLSALVNASLLQTTEAAGGRRYAQLVTLRAYAQERLRAEGEWEGARRRHAEYFLGLVESIVPTDVVVSQGTITRLEIEYENVRATLAWALETGATAHGLRMVGALWRFWATHAHFLEGLDWLERFIARTGTPVSHEQQLVLAWAWTGVLAISHRLGRFERALEAGEMALALKRALGDKMLIAIALNNLANPLIHLRDYERAATLFQESLALCRETNNREGEIIPLLNLGELQYEMGNPREALAYYEESLTLSHAVGESDFARALTWNNAGEAHILLDEPARAIAVAEPSYRLFVAEHDTFGIATSAFTLGRAHWRLGDAKAARAYLDEAARLFQILGNVAMVARIRYVRASLALERGELVAARRDLAQAFDDLASQARESTYAWPLIERAGTLACRQAAPERAARLYAAALAQREALGGPIEPAECALREHDLSGLRTKLDEAAWALARAEGQALTLADAVALARAELH